MRPWWVFSAAVLFMSLFALSGCGGGGGQSFQGGTPNRLYLGQAETLARDINIVASGGTVTVYKPGNPLHNLSLSVSDGAFPNGASFTISSTPITGHTFGTLLRPLTPLITIDNGNTPVDVGLMRLTIPITRAVNEQALAFGYNRDSGRMCVLSTLATSETALTISLTRCTPPARLDVLATSTGSLDLFVAVVDAAQLPATVDSGFRPGVDTWQHPNEGSYATPGGECVGWSSTALYYFLVRRNGVPLYNRYDNGDGPGWTTPQLWQDDTRAIRLTVATQRVEDGRWTTYLQALPQNAGSTLDQLNYLACRCAIYFTGDPQLLALTDPGGRGHVVIVYRVESNKLDVADPAYPANTTRAVILSAAGFDSYDGYIEMHYLSPLTMINWSRISDMWQLFDAGVVGTDVFPRNRLEWKNDQGQWEEIVGTITTTAAQVEIRAVVENVTTPGWIAYNRQQQALDTTPATGSRIYPLGDGDTVLGINILGKPAGGNDWAWINFQWITIQQQ